MLDKDIILECLENCLVHFQVKKNRLTILLIEHANEDYIGDIREEKRYSEGYIKVIEEAIRQRKFDKYLIV